MYTLPLPLKPINKTTCSAGSKTISDLSAETIIALIEEEIADEIGFTPNCVAFNPAVIGALKEEELDLILKATEFVAIMWATTPSDFQFVLAEIQPD